MVSWVSQAVISSLALGKQKFRVQEESPKALCAGGSNISDNSVSLREICSAGFFCLFVWGFFFKVFFPPYSYFLLDLYHALDLNDLVWSPSAPRFKNTEGLYLCSYLPAVSLLL